LYSLHKISVSVIFIFLFSSASGSDPYFPAAGAVETGMGWSCVMKPGFWSSFHNQSLLPFNPSAAAGINYHNRFGISELATKTAAIVVPLENAGLGLIYSHFGYRDLARHSAGLACGLRLSEKISGGIQADFFAEKTAGEYRERRSLSFEAGLHIRLSEQASLGIHVFNPVPETLRHDRLPSSLRVGAGLILSSELKVSAETEMSTEGGPDIRAGFEYDPVRNMSLRGGFSSTGNCFCFGVGYELKPVQIDLGFSTHDRLGISTAVSLIFSFR
jgi:hypothetical protein